MGVSGCGKSTVARALAQALEGTFIEGDDFHPAANKAKMAAGIPLTDSDRWPWYDLLIQEVNRVRSEGRPVFLSCSSLKQAYRDHLRAAFPSVRWIYLKGDLETLQSRVARRAHHFMPASLLQSQFTDLEEPQGSITLDITLPRQEVIREALLLLGHPAS
ncbi:MAG: gluconokinase [Candidatus Methylacidiphilales bacterium]|nr:gluconokinase [Candidatus Methylacidiphilales bacterium]